MSLSAAVRAAVPGRRWLPGQLGVGSATTAIGTGPAAGPEDPIGLTVEIFINGAWTDISPYVYYKSRIKCSRGRPNETSAIQPQTASMTINNRDGRFSPRNPLGPYYGQLGRNTPIRVSRLQNGVRRFRFHGEVPSWPTTWDITGTDVRVPITVAGQMRRLFQGNQPLHSPMRRTYGFGSGLPAGLGPYAYWPCEDGANSTSIASGLPGGTAMALSGQALPTFASNSAFPSSLSLPLLSGSIWTGQVPAYTGSSVAGAVGATAGLGFLLSVPATGAFDGGVLMRMFTSGTIARLDLLYSIVRGGALELVGYNSAGTQVVNTGYTSPQDFAGFGLAGLNALPVFVDMYVATSSTPGNVSVAADFKTLYPTTSLTTSFGIGSATVAGSVGVATSVVVNPDGHFNDTAVGHIFVQGYNNFNGTSMPMNGWITEPSTSAFVLSGFQYSTGRFLRLCQEQNVSAAVIAAAGVNAGDTQTMGYQLNDTFANLVQEPATTSAGLLFEARDQGALVLRERGTLYNQAAKLTLDYSQNQLSAPPVPVDDDALTRNDVTVQRVGGSSSQQVLTSGTLSTQPPPNGVGDYPTSYQLSLSSDALVADAAGWRLHLGTVDAPRYPQISINLRHPTFTSNLDLMNAALTIDIGDRLVITNPPAWMPPDPISLIVQGYSETLGIWEHDITFNCSPEDPYRVGLLDDVVLGRADTDGSTLAAPASATATTLLVATTNPASPMWTTNTADFPLDVNIGGERVTVTAITPQLGVDGTFETGVTGWTATNATLASSASAAHSGSLGCQVTDTVVASIEVRTPSFAIAPGATYLYSHWVKLSAGAAPNTFPAIDLYDASMTYLSTVTGTLISPSSTWANQTVSFTAPANAAFAQAGPHFSANFGNVLFVDDITFTQTAGSQAFTVTRSINGVVKAQTAGTDVRLWQPMYLSL